MIVLDTNVISEAIRPGRSSLVTDWLDRVDGPLVFTTSITQAEILFGIDVMPQGKRRTGLYDSVERMFGDKFEGRVLSFDESAARAYAAILAHKQRIGRPMSQLDAMIAAIARVNGASLATRNTADFEHCGIPLINPWKHALH